jgi:sugar phosphate isomerase/epimerase
MNAIQSRFQSLMLHRVADGDAFPAPVLTLALARKLLQRTSEVRLFAHAYPHLAQFTYGSYHPRDLLAFAHAHALSGISIHLLDGEERSLMRMGLGELRELAARADTFGIAIHLEISSTQRADVDRVVDMARAMGVHNIRVYSRYEGRLSQVLQTIETDLRYLAVQADLHDLYFDFEQHEELKSSEIMALLTRINHPRLNALFDFGNMVNAGEQPLAALRTLAPRVRQVHLKGVQIVPQVHGWGHCGVLQGSAQDDLPGPRMLYELLMLGDAAPQVVAFCLEQENHYQAPAFRYDNEDADPFIPYRGMSQTDVPAGMHLAQVMEEEERWAIDQITYVRGLLQEFKLLAELTLQGN